MVSVIYFSLQGFNSILKKEPNKNIKKAYFQSEDQILRRSNRMLFIVSNGASASERDQFQIFAGLPLWNHSN